MYFKKLLAFLFTLLKNVSIPLLNIASYWICATQQLAERSLAYLYHKVYTHPRLILIYDDARQKFYTILEVVFRPRGILRFLFRKVKLSICSI